VGTSGEEEDDPEKVMVLSQQGANLKMGIKRLKTLGTTQGRIVR